MTMLRFWLGVAIIIALFGVASTVVTLSSQPKKEILLAVPSVQPTKPVAEKRISPLRGKVINILLLGLDGRSGDRRPRCDAVHMVTFDTNKQNITITTVPRGTKIPIANIEEERAYVGNACHLIGIDNTIKHIALIADMKPDYVVKVGFSQALGIFRSLRLSASETLQFLRNRRLPGGDVQRSHNQAVFLKDMLLHQSEYLARLPKTLQYLLYRMVDTDMDFDTATLLFEEFLASGIYRQPNRVILITKPSTAFRTREIHIDSYLQQVPSSTSAEEFNSYQNTLGDKIQSIVVQAQKLLASRRNDQALALLKTPFDQQIWLQIEDGIRRDATHFEMLRLYTLSSPKSEDSRGRILDFIMEMESLDRQDLALRGKDLLMEIDSLATP